MLAARSPLNPDESRHKDEGCEKSRDSVFELAHISASSEFDFFAFFFWVRHFSLGMAVEKFVARSNSWWVNSISDWNPESTDDEKPRDWWPKGVSEKASKTILSCVLFENTSGSGQGCS